MMSECESIKEALITEKGRKATSRCFDVIHQLIGLLVGDVFVPINVEKHKPSFHSIWQHFPCFCLVECMKRNSNLIGKHPTFGQFLVTVFPLILQCGWKGNKSKCVHAAVLNQRFICDLLLRNQWTYNTTQTFPFHESDDLIVKI